jgi:hypothetical protein
LRLKRREGELKITSKKPRDLLYVNWLVLAVQESDMEVASIVSAIGPSQFQSNWLTISQADGNIKTLSLLTEAMGT